MKNLLPIAAVALAACLVSAGARAADPEAMKKAGCLACHSDDKKIVGPSYKDVAAKYKGDKAAVDKLAAKVMKGGSGTWGQVPMPANPQVNDAEAKKLVTWILSIK